MENKSQTKLDPATNGEPVNHARTKVTTNDEAPRWCDLYKAAMTESDPSKMLERVATARAAMVNVDPITMLRLPNLLMSHPAAGMARTEPIAAIINDLPKTAGERWRCA